MDFDETWRGAMQFRHASRELEGLLREVHVAISDESRLVPALARLLEFLASDGGRTAANCATAHRFMCAIEMEWQNTSGELHAILDDMTGALNDSIHRPDIARPLEATPEQLLARVRRLRS